MIDRTGSSPRTAIEKLLGRAAGRPDARSGEFVTSGAPVFGRSVTSSVLAASPSDESGVAVTVGTLVAGTVVAVEVGDAVLVAAG